LLGVSAETSDTVGGWVPIQAIRGKTYRLLGLTTLEKRRARGDLIETYKIISGREMISKDLFFQPALTHYGLRGHEDIQARCRTVLRKNSFSLGVIDDCTVFRSLLQGHPQQQQQQRRIADKVVLYESMSAS